MAIVRGTKGDDTLVAFDGDTVIAFAGSDYVDLLGGTNIVRLGAGDDQVNGFLGGQTGEAWGGVGDDYLNWDGSGLAVGGKGHDEIDAGDGCRIFGDEGPSLPSRVIGNDILRTYAGAEGGVSEQTGGGGADWFRFIAYYDGSADSSAASTVEVTDFTKGVDKLGMSFTSIPADGGNTAFYTMADVFGLLDTDGNGILDGTDAPLGPNCQTFVDDGDLVLRLREDTFRIDDVTSISRADWISG